MKALPWTGTVAEQKALIRDVRRTEFKDPEYKARLLASARAQLAEMRKVPRDQSELVEAVRKSLAVSLVSLLRMPSPHRSNGNTIPVNPPALLQLAAERVVKVFNNQKRDAVRARHARNDKPAKLRAAYATGRYASKQNCAMRAGADLGMSRDAALKALQNQPKPTRK